MRREIRKQNAKSCGFGGLIKRKQCKRRGQRKSSEIENCKVPHQQKVRTKLLLGRLSFKMAGIKKVPALRNENRDFLLKRTDFSFLRVFCLEVRRRHCRLVRRARLVRRLVRCVFRRCRRSFQSGKGHVFRTLRL